MLFYLFFFKQKTAYEMRISDWSSDVCSSDLIGRDHLPVGGKEAALLQMQVGHQQRPLTRPIERARGREDQLLPAKGQRERKGNHELLMTRLGSNCNNRSC